jgi:hypothetical protein
MAKRELKTLGRKGKLFHGDREIGEVSYSIQHWQEAMQYANLSDTPDEITESVAQGTIKVLDLGPLVPINETCLLILKDGRPCHVRLFNDKTTKTFRWDGTPRLRA